ncbi:MFS transporter [Acuticoccus kandeliae]|uniref:MFS transporter n=1 Tax=Acuticoccus kandeliae TaxID=2073160 RepID=UPI000D3E13C5|nr:MFS transporter [Acuticoccus kandeliae]
MLSVLANRTYRHMFAAQVLSLLGTGLTTVALGLLAYDLAGGDAGRVLGTALAIKMVAYVGIAPIAAALAGAVPRRAFLVTLDVVRAGMVALLPFVTEVWQIYVLVFAFQSCSAAFTPTFQATIPDVLPDEAEYTKALSLSRLAYDLESLVSPMVAGALLVVTSFHWLFLGNAIGFLASAALVVSVALPAITGRGTPRPFVQRLTRGSWIYLRTPRLRGLFALSFAVAAAGSMVIVNTVVVVKEMLGQTDREVAFAFAAYGLGSMLIALALPRIVAPDQGAPRLTARTAMLLGAGLLPIALVFVSLSPGMAGILALWAVIGAGSSLVGTPSGLLLRRSSHAEDRPALFAAQFALSHACWLVTYPTAGWLGAAIGIGPTALVLAMGAAIGALGAAFLWPRHDPEIVEHTHEELEHEHADPDALHHDLSAPRIHRHAAIRHAHVFVIDDHHRVYPREGR